MPSVPEFLDIFTEKRLVEVVRNLYAKQIVPTAIRLYPAKSKNR